MTTEDQAALAHGEQEFGGVLTQYVIDYLQEHAPEGILEEILELAEETRSASALSDASTWSSYAQFRRLLEATGAKLGGAQALRNVGHHVFDSSRATKLTEALLVLGSPTAVYLAMAKVGEFTAPARELTIEPMSSNECRVEIRMREPNEPFPENCAFGLGLLTSIPQIFGYSPAEILDEVCQCDGAPSCQARLRWEVAEMDPAGVALTGVDLADVDLADVDLAEVGAAETEPAEMEATETDANEMDATELHSRFSEPRLDDLQHTVDELVTGDGLQPVVTRVAAAGEARRQAIAAQALLALSNSLAELATGEEMVLRLARAVHSVLDCDRVLVSLVDAPSGIGKIRAAFGFDYTTEVKLRALEIPVPVERANSTELLRHRLDDESSQLAAALLESGSVAACSLAIASSSEIFGWITVDVTERPERLADDETIGDRLRGLAGPAAIAIRNSQLAEEIRHQALHDSLTGLPNRTLVVDRVEQAMARARREHLDIALLFVDLHGLKDVNDTRGHRVGDELIRLVATRFFTSLRASDTVARLGGDEFVVLAEGLSLAAGPELVAERLLQVLAEPFQVGEDDDAPVCVSASIGIAVGLRDSAEALFRDADVALYAAKDAGQNRYVVFDSGMQGALRSRYELEMDLQVAVGTDQLFLVYQPIFRLEDSALVAVEALLRWNHPTRGLLHPDEFLPALEASGLIIEVGRWVFAEACRQAMVWRSQGQPIKMSVNASGRQLDADTLLGDVRSALATSGLPPEALIVEITETCLMRDAKDALRQLGALKKTFGVKVAIDDFGTGYSSLLYLQQFPVDSLKIDRSFIAGMDVSAEGEALIHTLLQLGKALNLETHAEGIEEAGQLAKLKAEHCDLGQGYLFARPLAPVEVEKLFGPAKGGRGFLRRRAKGEL